VETKIYKQGGRLMKKGFAVALALVSCFTLALAGCGGGQKSGGAAKKVDYPTKNITMICPWGAGGGTDSILRALCKSAEKILVRPLLFPTLPVAAVLLVTQQS
jgi:tripartite-type tricarboxylate transporter receptor subunit TctC